MIFSIIINRIARWWRFRRECAWCRPQRYIGGNPWAKTITHGMCKECSEKELREIRREHRLNTAML